MDAKLFTQMLRDKNLIDLKKMQYKYSKDAVAELLDLLKDSVFLSLPLLDVHGANLVYLENTAQVSMNVVKQLLRTRQAQQAFGLKAMEIEIHDSLAIENIHSSRDSIRKILYGYAPVNEEENYIWGMKKGLEYIADLSHTITEENLHQLYQMAVGNYLPPDDQLLSGKLYRHDSVCVMGGKVEHKGLPRGKLPDYMKALIAFVNQDDTINELVKGSIIHFYFAYLHPYFDGNGRMARLLHLWYLMQKGYHSALFVPFSSYINESKQRYYKAYSIVEENAAISQLIDVTPFVAYFISNVYNQIRLDEAKTDTLQSFQQLFHAGKITAKETDLWYFVLSAYGTDSFSTKQLERDFGNAAYATIRSFVLKFESLGLLAGQRYTSKVKYHVC